MLINFTKILTRSTGRNLRTVSSRFLTTEDSSNIQSVPNTQNILNSKFFKGRPDETSNEISTKVYDSWHQLKVRRLQQNFKPIPLSESTQPELQTTLDHMAREGELFGGVEYNKLPIATILARWNNTIIHVRDPDDKKILYVHLSSRQIGIKGGKKKTEFAGEETGREAAIKALERACPQHVRVVLKGIGPGRKATIRGLGLGGFTVVSVSDQSPLYIGDKLPQRPRKIRRI